MDLLGTLTGSRFFDRDIPRIAKSLERIANILERMEKVITAPPGNPPNNKGFYDPSWTSSRDSPQAPEGKTPETGDN